MTTQTEHRAMASALDREHAEVERAASSMRAEMTYLREQIGTSASLGRLPALLLRFRLHLGRHFALEEQGGFFAQLARFETTRESVAGLLGDHARMDAHCARLVRSAQCAALGHGEIGRAFFAEVEALLSDLERHEQQERHLQDLLAHETERAG
jgi:hypothetical protein